MLACLHAFQVEQLEAEGKHVEAAELLSAQLEHLKAISDGRGRRGGGTSEVPLDYTGDGVDYTGDGGEGDPMLIKRGRTAKRAAGTNCPGSQPPRPTRPASVQLQRPTRRLGACPWARKESAHQVGDRRLVVPALCVLPTVAGSTSSLC